MLENVPGLARDPKLRRLANKLRALGYSVTYEVRNASDFAVPQDRNRLVLVGARAFTPKLPPIRARKVTVGDVIRALPHPRRSRDPLHNYNQTRSPRIAEVIRSIPKNGGSRADLPHSLILECHRRIDGFKDVFGRMAWQRPAPTITGGCINPSKGRFLHPSHNRAITLREAALLQGFPARYRFSLSRGYFPAAQMIGNAFPPKFAEVHARSLAKQLRACRSGEHL
jgi:DNA (cytosine-5)-methyltransferase 1